jgi:hypothetical protein
MRTNYEMHWIPPRLLPLILTAAVAAFFPASASAAGDARPMPPAGGHDVTRPAEMAQAAAEVAAAKLKRPLRARTAVIPLRPRAATASPLLDREVYGYARADSLGDPTVGYTTWSFTLLTDVAYFGITVNADGTLQNGPGLQVWQSATASGLVNTAHAAGVRVMLSLEMFDQAGMCQALSSASAMTTINAIRPLLRQQSADGVNIDYEGANAGCGATDLRHQLVAFVRQVRAANLGRLVIDTYASSAEDGGGFFDIPDLAGSVDRFFVMAYGLESSNGPCATCMDPTSPFDGTSPAYVWNDTRAANGYGPWNGMSILGFPFYGVAGCVAPNPPANAPVANPSRYAGVPYTVFPSLPANPVISSFQSSRDALDPNGQEKWASYDDVDPSLRCWREAYWDDPVSMGHKFDLVLTRRFAGAGMFTLDYGGGTFELWSTIAERFSSSTLYESLGGVATASPAVASWGPNRLDLFVRGTDNALYHRFWDGSAWSGWESLGGALVGGPAAVSWGPNRLDVFVEGTDSALYHRFWDGSAWSGWERFGDGTLTSAPAIASWASGRLDLFVRGTDDALYHRFYAGAWSGWERLGGQLASAPGTVSWAPNRIDVFAASATDASLAHTSWDGTWHNWESLGGQLANSAPAVASTVPGQLSVTVEGAGGGLYTKRYASIWGPFVLVQPNPQVTWQAGPAAAVEADYGRVEIFTVNSADGTVWHAIP